MAWIGLIPAIWALSQCDSWKEAWGQGFLFGYLYHAILLSWFWGLHPLTWMGFSPWVSLLVTGAAWTVASLFQGLIVSIIWLGFFAIHRRWPLSFLFLAPLVWVCGLWFLNQNAIGLPWGFLAYSQAGVSWIRESAYTFTFWGLEYLIVLVNIVIYQAIFAKRPEKLLTAATAILLIMSASVFHPPPISHVFETLNPVAIQGDIPIEAERLFLTQSDKRQYYQDLINLVLQKEDSKTHLILLPEGVIELPQGDTVDPYHLPPQTALLSGGIFQTTSGIYNGALLFSQPHPLQALGKRYLVPFGETTPWIPEKWLVNILQQWGIDYSTGFTKGRLNQPPLRLNGLKIGPLICFEALYPNLAFRYRKEGVGLLVTFSNLGWYHQNPLLDAQFLAMNQFRATESGAPLILITNTGLSAMISSKGNVLSEALPGKIQYLAPRPYNNRFATLSASLKAFESP